MIVMGGFFFCLVSLALHGTKARRQGCTMEYGNSPRIGRCGSEIDEAGFRIMTGTLCTPKRAIRMEKWERRNWKINGRVERPVFRGINDTYLIPIWAPYEIE